MTSELPLIRFWLNEYLGHKGGVVCSTSHISFDDNTFPGKEQWVCIPICLIMVGNHRLPQVQEFRNISQNVKSAPWKVIVEVVVFIMYKCCYTFYITEIVNKLTYMCLYFESLTFASTLLPLSLCCLPPLALEITTFWIFWIYYHRLNLPFLGLSVYSVCIHFSISLCQPLVSFLNILRIHSCIWGLFLCDVDTMRSILSY